MKLRIVPLYAGFLFHRFIEVVHLVVLGMGIQHVRPVEYMKYTCEYPTTFVFALTMSIVSLMHTALYADLVAHLVGGTEGVASAVSDLKRKFLASLFIGTAALLAGRDYYYFGESSDAAVCEQGNRLPIIFCALSFVTERVYSLWELHFWLPRSGKSHKEVKVPMNLEFTSHRLGEWVMLMLGESVLSLIIVEESAGRRYFVTFSAGIVAVTMMQYLYFRSNPAEADDHAMRRSVAGGFQFFYSILLYSACLIILGCSFKLILHHYLDEEEKAEEGEDAEEELQETARRITSMFSWSLAASFFFLDLMVIAHRGWTLNLSRLTDKGRIRWGPMLCTIGTTSMILLTALLPKFVTNLELLSVVGCAIILAQVLVRTLGYRYFPVSKNAMDVACRWPNVTEPRIKPHAGRTYS